MNVVQRAAHRFKNTFPVARRGLPIGPSQAAPPRARRTPRARGLPQRMRVQRATVLKCLRQQNAADNARWGSPNTTNAGGVAKRVRGVLVASDDAGCTVEVDGAPNQIPFDSIEQARTVFEWGPAAKPGRGSKPGRVKQETAHQ